MGTLIQMLEWNETEIMDYLEVFPVIEEDNLYHEFIVPQKGLILTITIYQYDGAVRFRLAWDDATILFQMWMKKCARIHVVRTEQEEYLEFISTHAGDALHVYVRPHVRILVI